MSVLRKICGITRRDRRRNSDVMKELDIEKDTVQVLQTRRLTYFGHVNRICAFLLLHGHTYGHCPKGRPRNKWIDAEMDISLYEATCHSPHFGRDITEEHFAANELCHRHRRNGKKVKYV